MRRLRCQNATSMSCRTNTGGLSAVPAVRSLRPYTGPSVKRLMQVGRSPEIKIPSFLSTVEMVGSGDVIPMAMTRFHPGDKCYEARPVDIHMTTGD